ncbi:MAG: class I SAM-dependent methyltransferase [Pirellula sp.]|jgi:SAM-dependent methyltransferase|nr:class I SAM-dependent methyltransferase [Pirellula sp.]
MGIIGGIFAKTILNAVAPPQRRILGSKEPNKESKTKSNLKTHFGDDFIEKIHGKTVLDFGCGFGVQSVEVAKLGAGKVIGIDILENRLNGATELAEAQGVGNICQFTKSTDQKADFILSKDSFEHFDDPSKILILMDQLLKPEGRVLASFGPTWYHPYGGHSFSVFPWAHLIFKEKSLIEWRSQFKNDGATRFREIDGGLNQLTIRRFESTVERSPFRIHKYSAVPIFGLSVLASKPLREFGASIVRYELVKK